MSDHIAKAQIFYRGPIVSRGSAIDSGHRYYFTAAPCRNGHIDLRYVPNHGCKKCRADNVRKHCKNRYKKNKETVIKQAKKWASLNPEKSRASKKKWKKNNPEKVRAGQRKSYINNKDARLKYGAKYREANGLRVNEACRKWREENREKSRELSKLWAKKNPDKYKASKARADARRRGAHGEFSMHDVISLKKKQGQRCANCFACVEKNHHLDHIMPIALGGSNNIDNLQILCPLCNQKKSKKHPLLWARENGRLL